MANNTLKTRIVLNNKTNEEWISSTYNSTVPLKGEVCIYSDLRKIKIGDGTTTISELKFANLTPEEVTQLIQASSHTHSNFDIINSTTASFTSELLTKLNGIATGAEVNQNAFSKIAVGSTTIESDTKTDTLTLVGSNVTITPDATNDKITIGVADGTTSAKGLVQLTDSTSSTSTTTAATPKSVKSAYDLANTAKTNASTAQSTADSKVGSVSLVSGTNNGTLKLTVDGTATDNIAVKGLGSAAYTNTSAYATSAQGTKADNAMPTGGGKFTGGVELNADPTTALGAATKQYVDTQITTKIAASDAMVFKGTLGTDGTITAVPTTGVVKGDTYKIITAGTWAGSACKIGDLIIALNSGSVEATDTNWAYVPSGNENETTIKYSTTTQNLTTSAQTGVITLAEGATKQVDSSISDGSTSTKLPTSAAVAAFVEGKGYTKNVGTITDVSTAAPLSGSGTSGSVTITHMDSGVVAGSYGDSTNQTPSYGNTFKVPYVTVDKKGHVTAIDTHTVKIPESDNTDTKVIQTISTSNDNYPLLATKSTLPTSGNADTAIYNTGVTVNPLTKTITADTFSGNLNGNATSSDIATQLKTSRTIGLGTAVMSEEQNFDGTSDIIIPITAINSDYILNGLKTLILDCGNAGSTETSTLSYWYNATDESLSIKTDSSDTDEAVTMDLSSNVTVTDDGEGNVTIS